MEKQEISQKQKEITGLTDQMIAYNRQITDVYFQLNFLKEKRTELKIRKNKLLREVFELKQKDRESEKEKTKEKTMVKNLTKKEQKQLLSILQNPVKCRKLMEEITCSKAKSKAKSKNQNQKVL